MNFDPDGFNAKKTALLADAEAAAEKYLPEWCSVRDDQTVHPITRAEYAR